MGIGDIIIPILIFAAMILISFIHLKKSKSILSNLDLNSLEQINIKVMQEPLKNTRDGFYYKNARLYFHNDYIVINLKKRPIYKMNYKPFIIKNKNTEFKIGIRSEYVLYPLKIKVTPINSVIIEYQLKEIFTSKYRLTIKPELKENMSLFNQYKIENWC